MRTIKFRGKTSKGAWLYGDLEHCVDDGTKMTYIFDDVLSQGGAVVPETVGQFTNLTDCEGNEIYDGDIIESAKGVRHVIKWNAERAAWGALPPCGALPPWDPGDYGITQSWLIEFGKKVIGNIHDNKDLMQEYNKQIS
jgi:hypothetical protein